MRTQLLSLYLQHQRLSWLGHLCRMNQDRASFEASYSYLTTPGITRSRRKTWFHLIREDLAGSS